ncbi:MAG: ribosomal protein S1p [Myxococcaceae bacterium]|nr:ribosomal protein S1p [Myxococcaceae bacterium]
MSAEKTSNTFADLFEAETRGQRPKKARQPKLGERVRAEVVQIGKDEVFVEIVSDASAQVSADKRATAFLHHEDVRGPDGQIAVKTGDIVEAIVVEVDPKTHELRLGRTMGRPAGLDELQRAQEAGIPVEGKVTGVNKGGLEVEMAGARAFCPISQADRGFVADPQTLIGRSMQFLVTEFKEGGKRIVVSRRAAIEREAREKSEDLLKTLAVGAVVRGTVSAVRDFGAFVDLGGIEGLVPNQELSYDRSATASGVLSPGDAVEVQVREIKDGPLDKRGNKTIKITLSLKSLASDPWDAIDTLAPLGRVLRGEVARVLEFGGFIKLTPGVEGLLHVSELGGKVGHPSELLKVGETLNVVVRSVDKSARKISLAPAPDGLEVGAQAKGPSITIGTIVEGTVDRIEAYGIFLQLEGTRGRVGRGLVPNVELGTPRGADNRKLFPLGTKLKAKVLETGDGKLKLSLKAIAEDEERADFDGFRANAEASNKLGTLGDKLAALLKKK